MDDLTKSFLRQRFSGYYSKYKPFIPREIEKREWGFINFEGIMIRHISFSSELELKGFLAKNPPFHAYYSTAYYKKPEANMEEKEWIKADLVFDIDADHLPRGGLKTAKRQITRLYDLLEEDFGCKDMIIVFSGSRGYHIHVYDEDFQQLGSQERREIVDYFYLNGINFRKVLPKAPQYLRLSDCIVRRLRSLIKRGELEKYLGLRRKVPELEEIISRKELSEGNFTFMPKSVLRKLPLLFEECVNRFRIYIDPPVTSDIKRLIRLPNSIHGKTSLRVTPIKRDNIDEFDPQRDAVAFGDDPTKVRVIRKVKLKLKDTEFRLERGNHKLPEFAALYLICRGVARFGW